MPGMWWNSLMVAILSLFEFYFFFSTTHPRHSCFGLLSRQSSFLGGLGPIQVREEGWGWPCQYGAAATQACHWEVSTSQRCWGPGTQQLLVEANISGGRPPQGVLDFPINMAGHLEKVQCFKMFNNQNSGPQAIGWGKKFHHLPSFRLQLWCSV